MWHGVVTSASFCSQKSSDLTGTVSYMAALSLDVLTVDPYYLSQPEADFVSWKLKMPNPAECEYARGGHRDMENIK